MKRQVLIALAAAGIAGPAAAQYREGVPAVIDPPPASASQQDAAAFRAAYAGAKRPRIVVFWNRAFSDQVATEYENHVSVTRRVEAGSSTTARAARSRFESVATADMEVTGQSTLEATAGTRRVDEQRPRNVSEDVDWRLEGGFQDSLLTAGVRLVDRATLMRTGKEGRAAGERANIQSIEAGALDGKADLILQVMMTPDPDSTTGLAYRVDVKDVRSGAVVVQFVTSAAPPGGGRRYYANEHGFTAAATMDADQVGRQLAMETMSRLAGAWSVRKG